MFKSRSIKFLFVLAGLAALLLSGCSTANVTDPADIRAVADEIAGYQLPEGYSEQLAFDLLDYQLVSLQGQTPNCHIYLVQAPKDSIIDFEALKEQVPAPQRGDRREARLVETRTASLRGQEVTVYVSEGINAENQPYRSVNAMFEGRGGPALVSLAAPIDLWDWQVVDEYLASLN